MYISCKRDERDLSRVGAYVEEASHIGDEFESLNVISPSHTSRGVQHKSQVNWDTTF